MMNRNLFRAATLGILLLSLAALPAAAQVIPAGNDFWVTPSNGQTRFTFPEGDVESLCGAAPSPTWDHRVVLQGIPAAGSDYDTVVARLTDAVFDANGNASTKIQVQALNLASTLPQATPCGELTWRVRLAGAQAVSAMKLRRTSRRGGYFSADIPVNVEFLGSRNGVYIGSLFYNIVLPDPQNGTPWSFGPSGEFRAGMTETDNCIDVLRDKLLGYPSDSSHFYFISNMIAQGKCERVN